jgi:hypothetical protein
MKRSQYHFLNVVDHLYCVRNNRFFYTPSMLVFVLSIRFSHSSLMCYATYALARGFARDMICTRHHIAEPWDKSFILFLAVALINQDFQSFMHT